MAEAQKPIAANGPLPETDYCWHRSTIERGPLPSPVDPLLAALIGKLPCAGEWPAERRVAWLRMMWMAFEVVYGAGEGAIEMPAFLNRDAAAAPVPDQVGPAPTPAAKAPDPPFVKLGPAFYIDHTGAARRRGGDAIMPTDVGTERLFDQRGFAGDLAAITWADGSTGVRGLQLDIGCE